MRVYVHTHGCRLNAAESRHWIEELESQGLTVTEKMDETVNVAIVNSCAVTDEAESKCRQSIRQIIRIQPEVGLIITGCMVERNPQALLRAHHRLLILGNGEKHRLVTHIRDLARGKIIAPIIRPILAKEDFTLPCVLEKDYPKRYNLKIQEGCDFGCSYCIIPRLRGKGRSRDFGNLLEDARIHVQKGVKEIVLTGINVGLYGNDSKHLSDVITALNDLPGLERIRLSSVEFKTLSDDVLEQMADPKNKLVPYLHLPVQSGSDSILRKMGRHYTAAEAQRFIDRVAHYISDVGLGTDLMVGFPGESDEDFTASVHFLRETALHYAHIFSYSRREGTPADGMEGQFIAKNEIARRSKVLRMVSGEKHRQFLEQRIGQVEEVLFEDREAFGFPGLTANYIRVFVPDTREDLTNQLRKVRLLKNCGTFMEGEIIP